MEISEIDCQSTHSKRLFPEKYGTCLLLRNAVDRKFCEKILNGALKIGFQNAHEKYPSNYRNNKRLQVDDSALAESLYRQCSSFIPRNKTTSDCAAISIGLNPRLRYCHYSSGESFSIHRDGVYQPKANQRSALTFLLYLNDSDNYTGGTTAFYSEQHGDGVLAEIKGCTGDVLIFDHNIWHSGNRVEYGHKYILRSDVMYKTIANERDTKKKHHDGYIWKILTLPNNLLATASRDKLIKIWNTNLEQQQQLSQHQNSVLDIATTPEGAIYAASRDGAISKWISTDSGYAFSLKRLSSHPSVLAIRYLTNGTLATSGSDNKICVWDRNLNRVAEGENTSEWHWQMVEHQGMLISCSIDGSLYIWDSSNLTLIRSLALGRGALRSLCMGINFLYVGDEQGSISKIALPNFSIVSTWHLHGAAVRELSVFSHRLHSCGEDKRVLVIDQENGSIVHCFKHKDFATSAVKVGEHLFSASYDGVIQKNRLGKSVDDPD